MDSQSAGAPKANRLYCSGLPSSKRTTRRRCLQTGRPGVGPPSGADYIIHKDEEQEAQEISHCRVLE
eukprot:9707740-Karenia_brevis.AAC.1